MFKLEHKSYCVDDVFHCQYHCLHYQTSHNIDAAAAHGKCDCGDGDADDGDCDLGLASAVVPFLIGLPVLPAHTDSHLTVTWMVTLLVYLFLLLHLHHSPQKHC